MLGIGAWRTANPAVEFDARSVVRVEVVMKETVDCAGRTGFYDEYGVVRDVLQNHLTELLALVALPAPRGQSFASKIV